MMLLAPPVSSACPTVFMPTPKVALLVTSKDMMQPPVPPQFMGAPATALFTTLMKIQSFAGAALGLYTSTTGEHELPLTTAVVRAGPATVAPIVPVLDMGIWYKVGICFPSPAPSKPQT